MKKGFTLIEILIVVAIIAILASVVLVGLGPTQSLGRDSRRISDIHEIQNGLELYYNKNGSYPDAQTLSDWAAFQSALTGAGVGVNTVPNDPQGGKNYFYGSNSNNGNSEYIVGATLENASGTAFNNYNIPNNYGSMNNWTSQPPHQCGAPDFCLTL